RTHAFVLNENEQYELVKIDEGLGDMLRGAMGWLKWQWGNLKDIFSKKGLPPAWQRSFSKAYLKDPKVAMDGLRKNLTDQGVDPEQIDKTMKQTQSAMGRIIKTRTGIQSKDVPTVAAMAKANRDIQQAGDDLEAQRAAAKQT